MTATPDPLEFWAAFEKCIEEARNTIAVLLSEHLTNLDRGSPAGFDLGQPAIEGLADFVRAIPVADLLISLSAPAATYGEPISKDTPLVLGESISLDRTDLFMEDVIARVSALFDARAKEGDDKKTVAAELAAELRTWSQPTTEFSNLRIVCARTARDLRLLALGAGLRWATVREAVVDAIVDAVRE